MTGQAGSKGDPTAAEVMNAARFLERVRGFVELLDPADRGLFACLIAPALAEAFDGHEGATRFDSRWAPERLPSHLVQALRSQPLDLGSQWGEAPS